MPALKKNGICADSVFREQVSWWQGLHHSRCCHPAAQCHLQVLGPSLASVSSGDKLVVKWDIQKNITVAGRRKMFGFEPERITHLILYISKITFFTQLWSILVMYRIYLCRRCKHHVFSQSFISCSAAKTLRESLPWTQQLIHRYSLQALKLP